MLLLFGLASVVGSAFGGYGVDRRGYRRNAIAILLVLALSLLLFSLPRAIGGASAFVTLAAVGALAMLAVAGFALVPLQQHSSTA